MLGRLFIRMIDAQNGWARPFGDWLHGVANAIFGRMVPVRSFLNGTWLGHPVHAVAHRRADRRAVPRDRARPARPARRRRRRARARGPGDGRRGGRRVRGLLGDRRSRPGPGHGPQHGDDRGPPRLPRVARAAGRFAGRSDAPDRAVDRRLPHPERRGVRRGRRRVRAREHGRPPRLATGRARSGRRSRSPSSPRACPCEAKVGVQNLVVVRWGDTIHALHDQCAHAGGPLSGGQIVDGCIECPWHGSRFELATGRRRRGPTVYDQPAYEVRAAEGGGYEVRRVS